MINNMTEPERVANFWSRVQRSKHGCWEWTGCRTGAGYGQVDAGGDRGVEFAHRYAWTLLHGPIPSEGRTDVCHACDNPACINPRHLFLGSTSDNVQDMLHKMRGPQGEKGKGHKLTEAQARELIDLARTGVSFTALAMKFGISAIQATRIAHGTSWRHLGGNIPMVPNELKHLPASHPKRMALLASCG